MEPAENVVAASFDERATAYASSDWHVTYAERLVALAGIKSGATVLDAATGTGFVAVAAARVAGRRGYVLGVDISDRMLDRARDYVSRSGSTNIELKKSDATALLELADASFDVVLCGAGLLYMPVDRALREWNRLLKPGGLVGFSGMREGFPAAGRLLRECAAEFGISLSDPATELGTEDRCREALGRAGFTTGPIIGE